MCHLVRLLQACFGAKRRQTFEHDLLVRDRQHPHAVVSLVTLAHRVDEGTTVEIVAIEPEPQRRPDPVKALEWRTTGPVNLGEEPGAPRPPLALQHRFDQAILRSEQPVERVLAVAAAATISSTPTELTPKRQ